MLNLARMLEDTARRLPDRDAIVFGDTRLSYAAVDATANQVANLLVDCGVRPGDRVALSCGNVPYFPIIYAGILRVGAAVVPLNAQLTSHEIANQVADCGARAYFCCEGDPGPPPGWHGWARFRDADRGDHVFLIASDPPPWAPVDGAIPLRPALAGRSTYFPAAATAPTDPAVVLCTSVAGGRPVETEVSHADLVLDALTCHRLFDTVDHDVHLVALPLFHSFGQTVQMNFGFSTGATLVLVPTFAPEAVLATMHRERVTFFAGAPAMYRGLLGVELSIFEWEAITRSLRMLVSDGSPLSGEIFEQVHRAFGLPIREGYDPAETVPTFNHAGGNEAGGNEAGGNEAGGNGYFGRCDAAATVELPTDPIVRDGSGSRGLEEVIMAHPAVSVVAVVSEPYARHGEDVKAFVIPKPGKHLTEVDLIEWCRGKVAGNVFPRIVEFCSTLPSNAAGKLLKSRLRERHGASSLRF